MGFLDFLKKKEAPASNVPRPPTPPGGAMVSKFDDRLHPMSSIAPPPPPGSIPIAPAPKPGAPASLPPLPAFAQVDKKAAPAMMPPSAPRPLDASIASMAAPKAPSLPPARPMQTAPAPKMASMPPSVAPLPRPLPPRGEAVQQTNSNVPRSENKVAMPQLTPPISGKSLPAGRPKSIEVVAPSRPKVSAAPSDEDLRRVLDELEQTDVQFDEQSSEVADRFIPLARFDDIVITIKMISDTVSHVRAVNEKLGHVETSTKTTIDDIGKAFEALHTKLLALDEKLFLVK